MIRRIPTRRDTLPRWAAFVIICSMITGATIGLLGGATAVRLFVEIVAVVWQ